MSSTQEEYVNSSGTKCPNCQKFDEVRTLGEAEIDGRNAWVNCKCEHCGSTWSDYYNLSGFDNLSINNKGRSARMFEQDKHVRSHALSMWANYIETGELSCSATEYKNMLKEVNELSTDQEKFVARLRKMATEELLKEE
jgi:hypothetical protein